MGFLRGIDGSDGLRWEPVTRAAPVHEEERRARRTLRLATGTLACERCDAPVSLGDRVAPTDLLRCSFCSHRAPARDFLSLAAPSRPARVDVWIKAPAIAAGHSG